MATIEAVVNNMGVRSVMKTRMRKAKVVCPRWPDRKRFADKKACGAASVRIANTQKKWRLPEACLHCNGWHLANAQ